jgi:hypothetical protein
MQLHGYSKGFVINAGHPLTADLGIQRDERTEKSKPRDAN